ncbi:MAG: replicative DNA helicase [Erysipelotrichaceae bacterium]|nr:replicative DNA helicase [Erysipelotrichaceae bacterium]MDY5251886.1 replicative DNA helicase [Erysipelotrichaceae bacterium]
MVKTMPCALEAESSLLGTIMLYNSAPRIAIEEGLRDSDFYLDANRKIFGAIVDIYNENKPIDITTVSTRLNDLNLLNIVGGIDYLAGLSEAAVTSANTKMYVDIIKDKAYMRMMIEAAQKILDEGFGGQVNIDEYLDEAEKAVLNVSRNRRTSEFLTGAEVIDKVIDNIHKMEDNHSNVTGVATGFRDLDYVTHGFQRSDLIILAARPSMGKTAFALNLAMNMAQLQNNEAVAIFSLEMPADQLISRILSAKSHVPGDNLRTGRLNNNEWSSINEAATELKSCKIFIDDKAGARVNEIFAKCRRLQSEHGLACVLIDYIQLITGNGKAGDNRQQEVSDISRGLKALARELNVPVIALSQLSRSVEQRNDKRPMLSDLRESGALEQDADIVMMLYRDSYYNAESKEKANETGSEVIEVNIAKHRNGATKVVEMAFEGRTNAFYNIDHSKE